MSFLTRCPICETIFRVDARTLAASDGAAKCGVCGMVFNAIEQHVPDLMLPIAAADQVSADPDPITLSDLEDFTPELGMVQTDIKLTASDSDPGDHGHLLAAPVPDVQADDQPWAYPHHDSAQATLSGDSVSDSTAAQVAAQEPVSPLFMATDRLPTDAHPSAIRQITAASPNEADLRSDVALADAAATGMAPVKRPTSAFPVRPFLLAALLAVLLTIQLAWFARYTLLARSPLLLTLATEVCTHASCLLNDSSRNLDSLRLVSTDLAMVPQRPHILHVHFTMQSDAALPLPVPAVSLILSDAQDNLLVQRNFSPAEFLSHRLTVLPSGMEIPGDLYLNVGTLAVANFKLLLIPG